MDVFEEPLDLSDYQEYDDELWASEPSASSNLLDYLGIVSTSLPVWAVIFIGLCLVSLTSLVNYDQSALSAHAQINSAAASAHNKNNAHNLPKNNLSPGYQVLPSLFTREVLYWEDKILEWASNQGIDPYLAATVMQIESCGHPRAISRAGALGLFQVMPYHFQTDEDGFDPATNALRGLSYLKQALDAHQGDVRIALAGYNAGITGSRQPEIYWPAETQRYVYWATGIYTDALAGNKMSNRLQEWLDAGGRSLCQQASQALELP